MSNAVAAVSAGDRLGFTLFLAVAVHAAAILGIGFSLSQGTPPPQTLEVTLAQYKSETAPEQADFIAQENQQGSGQLEEKALPSTREQADFQDRDIKETAPLQPKAPPQISTPTPTPVEQSEPAPEIQEPLQQVIASTKPVLATTASRQRKVATEAESQSQSAPPPPAPGSSKSLLARSLEIASLEAQLEFQQQEYAKRPRIKRINSASTRSHDDAVYLENWRRKIESVGNLNYPDEARRNKLFGKLRMMVSIMPDGNVKEILITQSSGNKILDDAAVRIVQLAAPFQPFPVEMRKTTDILEIVRTWKFEKTAQIY